jgi:hypothetical protein
MKLGYQTFEDFWPFYLSQHANATCRILHVFGSTLSLSFLIYCFAHQNWVQLLWCLPLGYGPAWIGHFAFEKNKPATFKYPRWSFLADFKMLWYFYSGQLNDELARYHLI